MTTEQQTILVVEDDESLAELTADYLRNFNYRVAVEHNGVRAVERIIAQQPDLVVLDVMLPGKDGIDVCREVRSRYAGPILMLTARVDQVDQILGLEIGADDYVCKPVEPRLLLARIKALLRRVAAPAPAVAEADERELVRFDNVSIDNRARRVCMDGEEVELSTPEYELLWLLASHAGTILSREMIFQSLRGIEYDGTNRFVDITVSHIRAKLRDDERKSQRIKTVRGKGYLLVPDA